MRGKKPWLAALNRHFGAFSLYLCSKRGDQIETLSGEAMGLPRDAAGSLCAQIQIESRRRATLWALSWRALTRDRDLVTIEVLICDADTNVAAGDWKNR
jgi:hypothetical protein